MKLCHKRATDENLLALTLGKHTPMRIGEMAAAVRTENHPVLTRAHRPIHAIQDQAVTALEAKLVNRESWRSSEHGSVLECRLWPVKGRDTLKPAPQHSNGFHLAIVIANAQSHRVRLPALTSTPSI